MSRPGTVRLAALALALCVAGCLPKNAENAQQAIAADAWTNPGGDSGKTHHSALTDIDAANVARLGLAWSADLGTNRGLEATPIVSDGVLYTSGVAGRVYAFNAETGKELWRFEPDVDMQVNRTVCCDMVNRGVALARGKVFVTALDAVMYALDARTGKVVWKTDTKDNSGRGISSTGAVEIAGDVVTIGNGGGDEDVRGYVSAFDLDTGKLKWRFYVVPHDPKLGPQESPDLEAALKTWDPSSRWDIGGGGSPWDSLIYDAETGLLLVGTGNGEPYSHNARSARRGDNLYLSSIVALDPRTGRVRWHYQEAPQEQWDYDATAPMVLTHLKVDGVDRGVVLHAPKNGFLYVLDRKTGQLLRANPIVRVNWASGVDLQTGRPRLTPASSDYTNGPQIIFPSTPGARNWHPASYDPTTGLYIGAVLDMGNLMFTPPGPQPFRPKAINNGTVLIFTSNLTGALATLPPAITDQVRKLPAYQSALENPGTAEVRGIDPLTGRTVWRAPSEGWQDRSGVLTTASGLTIHGNLKGQLVIRSSRDGKLIRTIDTGTSIIAAPMTYRINGVQFIAVMAAWGGGGYPFVPPYAAAYHNENTGRLLVFRLDGKATMAAPVVRSSLEVAPPPPAQLAGVTPETIAHGRSLFFPNCVICHANQHRSITPDVRRMSPQTHAAFNDIVLKGLYVPAGMPRWDDLFSPDDAKAIHAYLIDLQAKTRAEELEKVRRHVPLDAQSMAILSSY